jgi:hypothetical protein
VIGMENGVSITGMFLGAGLLASVVIPGLLVMWDRVFDQGGDEDFPCDFLCRMNHLRNGM